MPQGSWVRGQTSRNAQRAGAPKDESKGERRSDVSLTKGRPAGRRVRSSARTACLRSLLVSRSWWEGGADRVQLWVRQRGERPIHLIYAISIRFVCPRTE